MRKRASAFWNAAIVLVGFLAAHRMTTATWLPPETNGLLAGTAFCALYLFGLATIEYVTRSRKERGQNAVLYPGAYLLGTCLFLFGLVETIAPLSLSSTTVALHGLLALAGILGSRFVALPSAEHAASPSPSSDLQSVSDSPSIQLDDLIPRKPVSMDRPALRDFLSSRTVLVTGAGGSIGSELSAQLLSLTPDRLVLLDMSEQNLHQLETTLPSQSSETEVSFVLGDVRKAPRLRRLLARNQPDLVFHTAAYKHVHLMERHPVEALQNNAQATADLLRHCEHHDVDRFVFVSTDKAVRPKNILGATKQRAEWYVRTARSSIQAHTVRFGNVFGSTGSVVPQFERRLEAGEPLPVTHPEMKRYFMTQEEACQLLLETLLLDPHSTYILKMSDPVRIQWLAEQFIKRWRPNVNPDDLIEYVGRRPGEKLSERLVYPSESVHETSHADILGLEASTSHTRDTLDRHFQHIQSVSESPSGDLEQVRRLLLNMTPTVPASSA